MFGQCWPNITGIIGIHKGSYMSAHVVLNLLNPLGKRIRYIYICIIKKICKKKKQQKNKKKL